MVKNFRNLYINGCSFTAGDNVPREHIWPELISNELKYKLTNSSRNGNSFDTIKLTSIVDLANFDPEDTYVIIGLTWKERYGILFNQFTANITPADLDKDTDTFPEKLSTHRRTSSPYLDITNPDILYQAASTFSKSKASVGFHQSLLSFKEYYLNLVRYDEYLELNQGVKYLADLLALQGFLKENNFSYRFIDFPDYFTGDKHFNKLKLPKLLDKIDTTKIINMGWDTIGSGPDSTNHPDISQCKIISNIIKYRL